MKTSSQGPIGDVCAERVNSVKKFLEKLGGHVHDLIRFITTRAVQCERNSGNSWFLPKIKWELNIGTATYYTVTNIAIAHTTYIKLQTIHTSNEKYLTTMVLANI
jgi:hypothetical protein